MEPCIGIVCACLPTLPNLLRLWYRKAKTLATSRAKHTVTGPDTYAYQGSQKSKLRGPPKSDLQHGYEELDDAGLRKPSQGLDQWSGSNVADEDIGLRPVKVRQDV